MKRKTSITILLTFILICTVTPVLAKNLLEEVVNVPSTSYEILSFRTDQDQLQIKFAIDVTYRDITVYIMDEDSYDTWLSIFYPSSPYFSRTDYTEKGRFDVILGTPGEYFIVLDNRDSPFAAGVDVTISIETTGETVGIIVGIVVGVVAVIIGVGWVRRRKQQTQMNSTTPRVIPSRGEANLESRLEKLSIRFCDRCGEKTDTEKIYCPYCGLKM